MHGSLTSHFIAAVGVIGAALPLFWPTLRSDGRVVAHLVMTAAMVIMAVPGASAGWGGFVTGLVLVVTALWCANNRPADTLSRDCVAGLTAMALFFLLVGPMMAATEQAHFIDDHSSSHVHDPTEALVGASWIGLLVLVCWGAVVLAPLYRRNRVGQPHGTVTMTSGVLMLAGMAPMVML